VFASLQLVNYCMFQINVDYVVNSDVASLILVKWTKNLGLNFSILIF